jgi:hypothetical protein
MFEPYSCKDLAIIAMLLQKDPIRQKRTCIWIHNILIERKREEDYFRVFSELMDDVTTRKFRLTFDWKSTSVSYILMKIQDVLVKHNKYFVQGSSKSTEKLEIYIK